VKTKDVEPTKNQTTVARKSDRERIVTRTFAAPARIVFEAWTKPELIKRWWVPKSMPMSLVSCEMDVRTGGSYRLRFEMDSMPPMDFFGRYLDVIPNARLVWTNEEGGESGSTTTVTFEEKDGKTIVVVCELYPSKEALEADGAHEAAAETHAQLDELLASLTASGGA
jgi:uncharacterized protein YndB with AHSA1/START domain